ncbi:MAG: STAS domain-containing protein [Planctomycetota bacterium]
MKVTESRRDGIAVLRLDGEFDSFETTSVAEAFERCLAAGEPRVVMDLEGVSFANSTTIAYLIGAQRAARSRGGRLALARPRQFIRKTLHTLGLDQVFPICDSVEQAVAQVRTG